MSHALSVPSGRVTPRWSVATARQAAEGTWSTAGLLAVRASVWVGSPLLANGPSKGFVFWRSVLAVKPQSVLLSRLYPSSVIVPELAQLPPVFLATILVLIVRIPDETFSMPPPLPVGVVFLAKVLKAIVSLPLFPIPPPWKEARFPAKVLLVMLSVAPGCKDSLERPPPMNAELLEKVLLVTVSVPKLHSPPPPPLPVVELRAKVLLLISAVPLLSRPP